MSVEGKPWWRYQQASLKVLGFPVLWVVSPEVREGMGEDAPECVVADPDRPMFASLVTGLRAMERSCESESGGDPPRGPRPLGGGADSKGVFVLPVDCPAPASEVWLTLSVGDLVAYPTHGGENGHPLYLPWSFVTGTLLRAARSGDAATLRLDHLIKPVARAVPVDDPAVAINLNTPDDVRIWLVGRTRS